MMLLLQAGLSQLNGTAKHLKVVGIYFSLLMGGAIGGWTVRDNFGADDGVLWPAAAKRRIEAEAAINRSQQVAITELSNELPNMRTTLDEVQQITMALLRIVCLDPAFGRSVECRRVYQ